MLSHVLFLICYNDFKHVYRSFRKRLKLAPISAMIGLLFAFELETKAVLKHFEY
jgi:hypothetical protein